MVRKENSSAHAAGSNALHLITAPATWMWSGRPRTYSGTSNMPRAMSARPQAVRAQYRCVQALAIPSGLGNALNGMALVALTTGDTGQAERLLVNHRCFGRPVRGSSPGRCMFARSWPCGAGPVEAIALIAESLTRVRELHDKFAFVYTLVPLAAAAVLKGDDTWAARILGARDAVTERTGVTFVDKSVHDLRDRAEREVRAPRPGPVGPGVCSRALTHDRCVAEGHRTRLDTHMAQERARLPVLPDSPRTHAVPATSVFVTEP